MRRNKRGFPILQRKYFTTKKVAFAQRLRRNRTKAEVALWDRLSNRKLGIKFRQQAIVLGWIADFYCPDVALIIEVDGPSHDENRFEDDVYRDTTMEECGYSVIRFTNEQVLNDTDGVVESIAIEVDGLLEEGG